MYFLIYLTFALVIEFLFSIILYYHSYCGSAGQCDVIIAENTGITSCELSPTDTTVNNNTLTTIWIFSIVLFGITILTSAIYFVIIKDYIKINILVLIVIILIFAFNMLVYDVCKTSKCNITYKSNDRIRCIESNYNKSNVQNFYISNYILFAITIVILLIYFNYIYKLNITALNSRFL
jgi:hypothetical protein